MARLETNRQWRDGWRDQLQDQWRDRREAGRQLSHKLLSMGEGWLRTNTVVVALPRGGVAVAVEVAKALEVPLTTWSVRKLARAQAPEVAVGAISA